MVHRKNFVYSMLLRQKEGYRHRNKNDFDNAYFLAVFFFLQCTVARGHDKTVSEYLNDFLFRELEMNKFSGFSCITLE